MSFDKAELDLCDRGYVLVTGINKNLEDSALSNGSGKSSIWESIIWALTGNTVRGSKDVVNQNTTTGTLVRVCFSSDGHDYDITRTRNHKEYKTNLIIKIDGKDCSGKGIKDGEKLLSEYLPDITPELLCSVIILGQGLPQRFSNNTPSGRKELLETLSKSDFMISDLKNRVSKRKAELTEGSIELSKNLAVTENTLSLKQKELDDAKKSLEEKEKLNDSEISSLRNDIANLENLLKVKTYNLDELKDRLNAVSSEVEERKDELNEELERFLSENKEPEEDIERWNNLKADIRNLSSEIEKLKNVADVCPTCGQKLPDVHKIDTSDMEQKLSSMVTEESSLAEYISGIKWDIERKRQSILYSINNDEFTVEKSREKDSIKKEIKALEQEVSSDIYNINNLKVELAKKEADYNNNENICNELRKKISNTEESIKTSREKILYYNNEIEEYSKRTDIISKFDTALKRDFRGYLLEDIISYIDKKIKEYGKILFNSDKINFLLSGNNISITYQGKEIESLSGGERQKVDLLIQFSIRDMLCRHIGFSTNILVLDEIFDNLDSLGCEGVIELISKHLSDVSSVFIVTHRGDLAIPQDTVITVEKDESGISRLI